MARRADLSPAMAGSVLLHLSLAAALIFLKPLERNVPPGAAVPVTLVTSADVPDVRPAEAAPEPQTAQTEAPVPDAPAEPAAATPAPQPKPQPTPPPKPAPAAVAKPMPTPKPATPAVTPKPSPIKPAPQAKPTATAPAKAPAKSLNLDALAASIAKSGKTSSAPKGPARPETATQAREAAGAAKGLSASFLAGLQDQIRPHWTPNCEVEGGRDVRVKVGFILGAGGQVIGTVDAGGQEYSSNPVIKAAAERAIRAVLQTAPFSTPPRDLVGQKLVLNFNAREACS